MKTHRILLLSFVAVLLAVPTLAQEGVVAEKNYAALKPAVVRTSATQPMPRNLPPATLLAFALMASSGTPLPQNAGGNGR